MMLGVFTFYLLAMFAIIAKKQRLSLIFIMLGLVSAALLFWYHVTTKLNINL